MHGRRQVAAALRDVGREQVMMEGSQARHLLHGMLGGCLLFLPQTLSPHSFNVPRTLDSDPGGSHL